MINIAKVILQIEKELTSTFSAVDLWFEKPSETLHFIPNNSGWTISENLEHIYLANKYYLELIEKGKTRALENQLHIDWRKELLKYNFYKQGMDAIGITKSFHWTSPAYMKPSGDVYLKEIREEITNQKRECRKVLYDIPNGEGLVCQTTITINDLGTVDVYQYIWFWIKHTQRHLQQMENNEKKALQMPLSNII